MRPHLYKHMPVAVPSFFSLQFPWTNFFWWEHRGEGCLPPPFPKKIPDHLFFSVYSFHRRTFFGLKFLIPPFFGLQFKFTHFFSDCMENWERLPSHSTPFFSLQFPWTIFFWWDHKESGDKAFSVHPYGNSWSPLFSVYSFLSQTFFSGGIEN